MIVVAFIISFVVCWLCGYTIGVNHTLEIKQQEEILRNQEIMNHMNRIVNVMDHID